MKYLRYNDQIFTLDGIQMVTVAQYGSGAKSNPYFADIKIVYTNEQYIFLRFKGENSWNESEKYLEYIHECLIEANK